MKILQISFHTAPFGSAGKYDSGGLNIYVEKISNQLAKNNHVTVVTAEKAESFVKSNLEFKSLNLSHSVTIVCYEIFKIFNKNLLKNQKLKIKIAPKSKINSLIKHLVGLLENKDFFIPKEKKQSMLLNINNLIYRLEPNDKELRILASIISSLGKKNIKP